MTPSHSFAFRLAILLVTACLCMHVSFSVAQTESDRVEWKKTDFSRRTVDLAEVFPGGPPKDGIPAIDKPKFVSVESARLWLDAREPVIVFSRGTDVRAYPLQILIFHEIVNDMVGGQPVVVTFCPLCNASIVFDRRVGGRVLDFGTTGRLRKSDLVMYDRQTESWWQQFTGVGIVGQFAGTKLIRLHSSVTAFGDFAKAYRAGQVLSRQTGLARPYGNNPYRGYDRIDQHPFLLSDKADPRLPPMERVLAVTVGAKTRLHPLTALEGTPVPDGEFEGLQYVIFAAERMASALDTGIIAQGRAVPVAAAYDRRLDRRVLSFERREGRTLDRNTGSQWNVFGVAVAGPLLGRKLTSIPGGVHFAFAWLAFNPSSEVVGVPERTPVPAAAGFDRGSPER